MTSGIQNQSEIVMTPQEAEAVLEIWAKRQAEGELRTRLNVAELAEAMNLPVADVERMLAQVRNAPVHTPPMKKARPVNSLLIALAIFIWFGILFSVGYIAYQRGRADFEPALATPMPPPMEFPVFETVAGAAPSPAPVAAWDGDYLSEIPSGFRVQFKGFDATGTASEPLGIEQIRRAFQTILRQIGAPPSSSPQSNLTDLQLINAIADNDAKATGGIIKFESFVVNHGNRVFSEVIPVAMTGDSRVTTLVSEEQQKRLLALASKVKSESDR